MKDLLTRAAGLNIIRDENDNTFSRDELAERINKSTFQTIDWKKIKSTQVGLESFLSGAIEVFDSEKTFDENFSREVGGGWVLDKKERPHYIVPAAVKPRLKQFWFNRRSAEGKLQEVAWWTMRQLVVILTDLSASYTVERSIATNKCRKIVTFDSVMRCATTVFNLPEVDLPSHYQVPKWCYDLTTKLCAKTEAVNTEKLEMSPAAVAAVHHYAEEMWKREIVPGTHSYEEGLVKSPALSLYYEIAEIEREKWLKDVEDRSSQENILTRLKKGREKIAKEARDARVPFDKSGELVVDPPWINAEWFVAMSLYMKWAEWYGEVQSYTRRELEVIGQKFPLKALNIRHRDRDMPDKMVQSIIGNLEITSVLVPEHVYPRWWGIPLYINHYDSNRTRVSFLMRKILNRLLFPAPSETVQGADRFYPIDDHEWRWEPRIGMKLYYFQEDEVVETVYGETPLNKSVTYYVVNPSSTELQSRFILSDGKLEASPRTITTWYLTSGGDLEELYQKYREKWYTSQENYYEESADGLESSYDVLAHIIDQESIQAGRGSVTELIFAHTGEDRYATRSLRLKGVEGPVIVDVDVEIDKLLDFKKFYQVIMGWQNFLKIDPMYIRLDDKGNYYSKNAEYSKLFRGWLRVKFVQLGDPLTDPFDDEVFRLFGDDNRNTDNRDIFLTEPVQRQEDEVYRLYKSFNPAGSLLFRPWLKNTSVFIQLVPADFVEKDSELKSLYVEAEDAVASGVLDEMRKKVEFDSDPSLISIPYVNNGRIVYRTTNSKYSKEYRPWLHHQIFNVIEEKFTEKELHVQEDAVSTGSAVEILHSLSSKIRFDSDPSLISIPYVKDGKIFYHTTNSTYSKHYRPWLANKIFEVVEETVVFNATKTVAEIIGQKQAGGLLPENFEMMMEDSMNSILARARPSLPTKYTVKFAIPPNISFHPELFVGDIMDLLRKWTVDTPYNVLDPVTSNTEYLQVIFSSGLPDTNTLVENLKLYMTTTKYLRRRQVNPMYRKQAISTVFDVLTERRVKIASYPEKWMQAEDVIITKGGLAKVVSYLSKDPSLDNLQTRVQDLIVPYRGGKLLTNLYRHTYNLVKKTLETREGRSIALITARILYVFEQGDLVTSTQEERASTLWKMYPHFHANTNQLKVVLENAISKLVDDPDLNNLRNNLKEVDGTIPVVLDVIDTVIQLVDEACIMHNVKLFNRTISTVELVYEDPTTEVLPINRTKFTIALPYELGFLIDDDAKDRVHLMLKKWANIHKVYVKLLTLASSDPSPFEKLADIINVDNLPDTYQNCALIDWDLYNKFITAEVVEDITEEPKPVLEGVVEDFVDILDIEKPEEAFNDEDEYVDERDIY